LSRLFSDDSLTRKASLNALASVLDYAARLLVSFMITPLMVSGLGDYAYGVWQILNRLVGYITPATGRATYGLKWALANLQGSTDYDQKRRYVGSTLVIWAWFSPLLITLGGVVTWFAPSWVRAPTEYVWVVRAVSGLLLANVIAGVPTSIPRAVLQGENLGYKRIGMSIISVLAGGGFTWLALYLKTGLLGVALSAVLTTVATGLVYLMIVRRYAPWFGIGKPLRADTSKMMGLSWWFMAWNMVTSLLLASDVVVLGLLGSAESVTDYSLTKYVPEMLIGVLFIIFTGVAPGLGGILGSKDYARAVRLRGEMLTLVWLAVTALGTSILLWNEAFLGLWVGSRHYSGSLPNLLIVMGAIQLVYIRTDGQIIDVTLRMSQKVLLGVLSVTLSIAAASIAVGYLKLGVVGLCLGTMAGRLIMTVGYPALIGRFLGIPPSSQLKSALRPSLVTALLLPIAFGANRFFLLPNLSGLWGWTVLIFGATTTAALVFALSFYVGLSTRQRKIILRRVSNMIPRAESSP
jgi:O-antigen/teichoic acid export membrane protein